FIEQKGWLEEGNSNASQALFDQAEKARSRVEFGRKANACREIGADIRMQYDRAVWDRQPKDANGDIVKKALLVEEGLVKETMAMPDGAVAGWITCDLPAARNSVNAAEKAAGRNPMKLKNFASSWQRKEKAHMLKNQAATEAKANITGCSA
ncbi:hypothetical protein BO83DRAFT_326996, partial [Aspergillus eucalypticola CBS 122712]